MDFSKIPALQNFKAAQEVYEATKKAAGRDAFKQMALQIFEQFPLIEAMRFCCYTPSFNDGDPCTFSITELQVVPADHVPLECGGDDGRWSDAFGLGYYKDHPLRDAQAAVKEFNKALNGDLEELVEAVFGSGVQVTMTREGIEVEDYDCGY